MAITWVVCLAASSPSLGLGGIFASCKVIDGLKDRPVVILDAGRTQGIALGDRAVLLGDGQMAAVGRVFYLEPNLSAVRLGWRARDADRDDAAVVVSQTLPSVCRIALPSATTVSARVEEVAPGHRTAWLDQGLNAGLLLGDALLVDRPGGVIARADVVELYGDQALVRLARMAPRASVRAGDRAHLWPSPGERRTGRIDLPVLRVEPAGAEHHVWLPGGPAEGVVRDRRIELFRGGSYIATAVVDRAGLPLTRATTVEAYVRQAPKAGDRAVLLAPTGGTRRVGRIFRIDRDYCLVSAGEDAGVRRGQRLYVVRGDRTVATLTVETVKQTYCGTSARPLASQTGDRPRLWDQVLSQPPQKRLVQEVGKIERVSPDGLFASVSEPGDAKKPEAGTLISVIWHNRTIGAAAIIHKTGSGIILYTPSCWRDHDVPPGAQVLYSQALPGFDE